MKNLFLVLAACAALILLSGCSLAHKSWASAGSCDAFKIVMSDAQGGNYVPTIIAGGGAHCMAFQKPFAEGEQVPPVITYSRRKSMWGLFSGDLNAGNVSFVYIGGTDEKPEDTAKILEAVSYIVNHDIKIKELEKKDED